MKDKKDLPQTGDSYVCKTCGMTLQCTVACGCTDPACVNLQCCNQPMVKAPK